MGQAALKNNIIGDDNTALGRSTLENSTGNRNIGLGKDAGLSLTGGDDNIYIGSDSGSVIESLQIRIGSSQVDCFIQGIFGAIVGDDDAIVSVDSDGKLGTISSSGKYKRKSDKK